MDDTLENAEQVLGNANAPLRNDNDRPCINAQMVFVEDGSERQEQNDSDSLTWEYSHGAFLMGSVLYVWLAVWDICNEKTWSNDDDSINDDVPLSGSSRVPYLLLSTLATLAYLAEACFALRVREKAVSESGNPPASVTARNISLALSFGLGALLDFISVLNTDLNNDDSTYWGNFAAICSVHFYAINALLVLSSKSPWSVSSVQDGMELMGDLLFLVGSVIDVALSYFSWLHNDDSSDRLWKLVNRGNLMSSLLWLMDAVVYIVANSMEESAEESDSLQDPLLEALTNSRETEPATSTEVGLGLCEANPSNQVD